MFDLVKFVRSLRNTVLREISIVAFPANSEAKVVMMKSGDKKSWAKNLLSTLTNARETAEQLLKEGDGEGIEKDGAQLTAQQILDKLTAIQNLLEQMSSAETAEQMSPEETDYMNSMPDPAAKQAFAAMPPDTRKKIMSDKSQTPATGSTQKNEGGDTNQDTIQKAVFHDELQKRDAVIADLQKKFVAQEESLARETALRKAGEYERKATTEYPFMKGTPIEKGLALQAVDAISDEPTKNYFLGLMKSANDQAQLITAEAGTSATDTTGQTPEEVEFDKSVRELADSKNMTYQQAVREYSKTTKGAQLFRKMRKAQNQ